MADGPANSWLSRAGTRQESAKGQSAVVHFHTFGRRFVLSVTIMTRQNSVAVIANREGRDSQALLAKAAEDWRAAGVKVVGILAENNDTEGMCSADFVRDIASGTRYSVHLDAPPPGKTCHLDAAGMDEACAGLLGQIALADVVVLSKFGKLEAMQQGLWPAFAAAVATGKPLLTTVSARHMEAWRAFAHAPVWLEPDGSSAERWWQAVRPTAHHREQADAAPGAAAASA
jgi:nucleoside-triphosphatase THEP1